MAVGAIFAHYGAGSGLSTLIRVFLDNFGRYQFYFWTIVVLIANTLCTGELPAIPGAAIAVS